MAAAPLCQAGGGQHRDLLEAFSRASLHPGAGCIIGMGFHRWRSLLPSGVQTAPFLGCHGPCLAHPHLEGLSFRRSP